MIIERGFFDRFNYTQVDHTGFNHTASWADCLKTASPLEGQARFAGAWGGPPASFKTRKGYVLVLCQIARDAQLNDSELRHPQPFLDALLDSLPHTVDVRLRLHPEGTFQPDLRGRAKLADGDLKKNI